MLPPHVHEKVVSLLDPADASRLAQTSLENRALVVTNDAYWIEQLRLRGIIVPDAMPAGTAHKIYVGTLNGTCSSCRGPNDGGRCPISGRLACVRCRKLITVAYAADAVDLPATRAVKASFRTHPYHTEFTTRAVAAAERDRRIHQTPKTGNVASAEELAQRFGIPMRWFGPKVPGGIPVAGYDAESRVERYDVDVTRRWAENRQRFLAAVRRLREGRERHFSTMRRRRGEEHRALAGRVDRVLERLSTAAERYDPPLDFEGCLGNSSDGHEAHITIRNRLSRLDAETYDNTLGYFEHEGTLSPFTDVRESEFPACFQKLAGKTFHTWFRLERLAENLGLQELPRQVLSRAPTDRAAPTALDLYLFAGVKERFDEAAQELRAHLAE